jgi:hypothetical protein
MRNAILIATAFIIATATLTSAQAANYSLEDGGKKLVVSKKIVRGDLKRFRAVLASCLTGQLWACRAEAAVC